MSNANPRRFVIVYCTVWQLLKYTTYSAVKAQKNEKQYNA